MAANADNPGVIAPPPLIALAALVLGLALDWLLPVHALTQMLTFWPRVVIGAILALAGGVLAVAAERRFHAIGTNVPPWKPSLQLATTGVYAHLRNPMYVGLMLLVLGIGIGLASDWTLVLIIPMVIVLHYGVVLREERYLERKFDDEYRHYKANMPRWGLW